MLTLFFSRAPAVDETYENINEESLKQCIANLWQELIAFKKKEDLLIQRVSDLEADLLKVKPGSEAALLINNSLAMLQVDLRNLRLKSNNTGQEAILYETAIIKRIDSCSRKIVTIRIRKIAKEKLEALEQITSTARLAAEKIIENHVQNTISAMQLDTSIVIAEEYLAEFTDTLESKMSNLTQELMQELDNAKAREQIQMQLIYLEHYVDKLKSKNELKKVISMKNNVLIDRPIFLSCM